MFTEHDNIDLVLMDIQIPEIDGYELTRRFKKLRPSVPIIAQTAFAMQNDRSVILEAGCDHYISKPINIYELLKTISDFIPHN